MQATLAEIDQAFRGPLYNLRDHLHLLRLGPDAQGSLQPALEQMKETRHRVEGHRSEVEYCARESVSLGEWESLASDHDDGRLALLVPIADPQKARTTG